MQKGANHKTSRATIFREAVEDDQRLERECFPANIFISSCLQIAGYLASAKGSRQMAINSTTLIIVKQARNPGIYSQPPIENFRGLVLALAYLQGHETAPVEKYRRSTARLHDARNILFQNTY